MNFTSLEFGEGKHKGFFQVKIPDNYFILGGGGKINGYIWPEKMVKKGDRIYRPGYNDFHPMEVGGFSTRGYFLVIRHENNREGHPYTTIFK